MTTRPRRFRSSEVAVLTALLLSSPLPAAEPATAVVVAGVANLYARPDETSGVDDQVVLGEAVSVLEETAGFARVLTKGGSRAWIPERDLRRGGAPAAPRSADVASTAAHVYRTPDVTESRPLVTAPLGARLGVEEEFEKGGHVWLRVVLPDGRSGFLQKSDTASGPAVAPGTPDSWLALARRFLGAPYTWGGTTPAGADCSGLVWRVFERHGVVLKRNSSEMCFREPRLVPIRLADVRPGDLVFFGTDDKIDHMAMWVDGSPANGRVLEATAYGVPSAKITDFATGVRMKPRVRYARRLADLPGAKRPAGLSIEARAALEKTLAGLAAEGGATYGVFFEDLSNGATIALGADRAMHAASTMKTPVLLEVLRRVDEGSLRLEDPIPVKNEFESLVDGSPFSVALEGGVDAPTAARIGGTAPLAFLVREMIVRSSNLATNVVLSLVGPEAVQRFTDALGAPTVKVRRAVEDGKAFDKGINNETDARGMGAVMAAVWRSPKLSEKARATAWEILAGQTLNGQIPAGLHPQSGAVVAHKTGSISSVQHDAAIVKLPDGRAYVLVLLANDFGANESGRQRVIETTRKMSRAVWDAAIAPP